MLTLDHTQIIAYVYRNNKLLLYVGPTLNFDLKEVIELVCLPGNQYSALNPQFDRPQISAVIYLRD